MIDESPNIIKLKSRNIFNEIREKVKPITATEEKQDKRVEGQESIEEILSDIFDEVCQRTHAFKKREQGFFDRPKRPGLNTSPGLFLLPGYLPVKGSSATNPVRNTTICSTAPALWEDYKKDFFAGFA